MSLVSPVSQDLIKYKLLKYKSQSFPDNWDTLILINSSWNNVSNSIMPVNVLVSEVVHTLQTHWPAAPLLFIFPKFTGN